MQAIVHPFKVALDDHCESPMEAYRDIAPLLHQLAKKLNKQPADLSIYDPYYCAGMPFLLSSFHATRAKGTPATHADLCSAIRANLTPYRRRHG